MALPENTVKREERLAQFGADLNKLANYLRDNLSPVINYDKGQEAVEIAIEIFEKNKSAILMSNRGNGNRQNGNN